MRSFPVFIRRAALGAFLIAAQASGQSGTYAASHDVAASASAVDQLPDGPGHDATLRVCSSCHSAAIATKQRLSKTGWHDLVETMAGRGAQGTDADFVEITDYLSKNYPEKPAK